MASKLRAKARARKAVRSRAPKPVLGNDPFLRGAALRATPTPTPTPTATPPATPTGLAGGAGALGYAAELGEMLASLLPALKERLAGLGSLLRLAQSPGALDPHGMDPTLLERAAPILDFLYLSWWRVEASTAARVPATGPVVVVANHGGALPWDALVLRLALRREHPAHRDLRPLLDAPALRRPFWGRAAIRLGAVAATPENASQLLAAGEVVAVFPEGSGSRPWPQRYRIGAFGRGGFAKLALRHGAAIVPCAIVGSEEASAPVGRSGFLAETLRLPILGAAPALPLGPLADLPLPSRWTLRFGEPLGLGGLGPAAADDPAAVEAIVARTRGTLQSMLDESVAARRSVFV